MASANKEKKYSDLKPLQRDIHLLGTLLGEVIQEVESKEFFITIEKIRVLSKKARAGDKKSLKELHKTLASQSYEKKVKIIKAFTEFLRLANCAEQFHRVRRRQHYEKEGRASQIGSLDWFFSTLPKIPVKKLISIIQTSQIDLVFTAHPTEALRPSAIRRNRVIATLLLQNSEEKLSEFDKSQIRSELKKNIFSLWHTDILKPEPPTPLDEARSGHAIVEEILWPLLPVFQKRLQWMFKKHTKKELPDFTIPFKVSSWMGGDRDGNPSVTTEMSVKIFKEATIRAQALYRKEFFTLWQELPFQVYDNELIQKYQLTSLNPYRELIQKTVHTLDTKEWGEAFQMIESVSLDLFHSLKKMNLKKIAEDRIYDIICRIKTFGPCLMNLDFRQERSHHRSAVQEILEKTFHIKNYESLSESDKNRLLMDYILKPKLSFHFDQLTPQTQELLRSIELFKKYPASFFGIYIISMAEESTDVLEVYFLQKIIGLKVNEFIPVAPLFETPESLKNSTTTLEALYQNPAYLELIQKKQHIMLGYSDSTKRSGKLASSWLIFQKQLELIELEKKYHIKSVFFHGRGGSIGRGGGPIRLAMSALPRGSSSQKIRITEQGESIDSKYGQSQIALRTLELYFSSTLESFLSTPQKIPAQWNEIMNQLSIDSETHFRNFIYEKPEFLEFFKSITPIEELGFLQIGSRPKKRAGLNSFESLRAIPWIFSWTQNRFIIPAWFGAGEALHKAVQSGHLKILKKMYKEWPHFQSTLDLLEMVLAKSDLKIAQIYSSKLVPVKMQKWTDFFIEKHHETESMIKKITGHKKLLATYPVLHRSIKIRNSYVDILNILQVELLKEYRATHEKKLEKAIALSISGISAGMRNTG